MPASKNKHNLHHSHCRFDDYIQQGIATRDGWLGLIAGLRAIEKKASRRSMCVWRNPRNDKTLPSINNLSLIELHYMT